MAEPIRATNVPIGTDVSEFLGIEKIGTTRSVKRFTRANVLGSIEAATSAFIAGGGVVFTSRTQANANLNYDTYKMAWVVLDSTPANNGVYQKIGTLGSGSWVRVANLPYSFYRGSNAGTGTANAWVVTSDGNTVASTSSLIAFNVLATNTDSTVTVTFDGGSPLTIVTASGNAPAVGGLQAGMVLAGYIEGENFRLLSDQASAAIVSAAEAVLADTIAAKDAAQAAAEAAVGAAQGLLPIDTFATVRGLEPGLVGAVYVKGRSTIGDGGDGAFYWDATSTAGDDGATVLKPDDVTVPAPGRWIRMPGVFLRPAMFGVSSGLSDNTTAYTAMMKRARELALPVVFPPGTFKGLIETSPPDVAGNIATTSIIGAGENRTFLLPPSGSNSAVVTMRGMPEQIFRRITAATKSSTCTLTLDDVDGLSDGMSIQIYGVDGMTDLNGHAYGVGTIDVLGSTITLNDLSTGDPIDSTSFGTYEAGGSVQKLVVTTFSLGGELRDLTIDGTGGSGGTGLSLMGLWGTRASNLTVKNHNIGVQTSSDLLWHAFDNQKIATIYNENPIRIEFESDLPSGLYETGANVFLQGIAGTIGDALNGVVFSATKVDDTHITVAVDGTGMSAYAGGGAASYTNADYSGNVYCKLVGCTISFNTAYGFWDSSLGSFTSGEFDQCHVVNNGNDGLRFNSHAIKFQRGQVAYNGINSTADGWNSGNIVGIRIGTYGLVKNCVIENNQFDSNKSAHIDDAGGRGTRTRNNDFVYGGLSKTTGNTALRGPQQMLSFGAGTGVLTGCEVEGMECRFDDGGNCTVATIIASQCTGVHIRGLNTANNSGGATVTVASSQWTTLNNNYLNDYSITGYDGTVYVAGKSQRGVNASFCAHKNGTNQTGISPDTSTLVTFGTEVFDYGGYYNTANSTWTPPAGPVEMGAKIQQDTSNTVADTTITLTIQKNGSEWSTIVVPISAASSSISATVHLEDVANGTDAYRVVATLTGSGSKTILGSFNRTQFWGKTR